MQWPHEWNSVCWGSNSKNWQIELHQTKTLLHGKGSNYREKKKSAFKTEDNYLSVIHPARLITKI